MRTRRQRAIVIAGILCALVAGCQASRFVGRTYTHIDERRGSRTDEVPIMKQYGAVSAVKLIRNKQHAQVTGYLVWISIVLDQRARFPAIEFDDGERTLRLEGAASVSLVRRRAGNLEAVHIGSYAITPDEIRELSTFGDMGMRLEGTVETPTVHLRAAARSAINTFRETFVERDGIGANVTRVEIE